MKKLFALLMVAGTFAMYSCGGGEKKAEGTDSTAAQTETTMEPAADTSAAAPVDSAAAAPADSAAAAPAPAH
jgi:hypothetical protein